MGYCLIYLNVIPRMAKLQEIQLVYVCLCVCGFMSVCVCVCEHNWIYGLRWCIPI